MSRETTTPFITPYEMAEAVNTYVGESRVRWSEEFNSFVTKNGDRYATGSIEDIAAGLLRQQKDRDNGDA